MDKQKYWFFGSKLNTFLLLILIILMVIALRWMYQDKEKYLPTNSEVPVTQVGTTGQTTTNNNTSEDSTKEIFSNQPGSVKSITGWTVAIDILTPNPNWIPGVDSSGPFFLNQSQKIRNLKVDNSTMIYPCEPASQNISTYLQSIQKRIDDYNKLNAQQKASTYVAYYFDINGSIITSIREQCLP
ncbi:MAG: hypothetical protein AAB477_01630 [Patescibacteria group bacterium]